MADKRTIIERLVFFCLGLSIGVFYSFCFAHDNSLWLSAFMSGMVVGGVAIVIVMIIWAKRAIEAFFYVEKDSQDDWWRRGEEPPY